MTRTTITITAPNGAKVRTVASKTFYVVLHGEEHDTFRDDTGRLVYDSTVPGTPYAKVYKRTDSIVAAADALRRWPSATVYRYSPSAAPELRVLPLDKETVNTRAQVEKRRQAFAKRTANNGPARSLQY